MPREAPVTSAMRFARRVPFSMKASFQMATGLF
jgi:hypothetical protein